MIPRLTDDEITSIYTRLTSDGIRADSSGGLQQIQIELQMRILDSINKVEEEEYAFSQMIE
jgi:hypothetical protein